MDSLDIQVAAAKLRAPTGKLFYRINDACAELGVGRTTLYRLISEGKLRTVKVYGSSRVTGESLRDFAMSLMMEAN